jgi:hypothetical protein
MQEVKQPKPANKSHLQTTDDTKNTVTFTVTDSSLVFNEGRESHPIMNRFYCTEDMGAKTLDGIFAFTVAS